MKTIPFIVILIVVFTACTSSNNRQKTEVKNTIIKEGIWRAALKIDAEKPELEIPFLLNINKMDKSIEVEIINAEENIVCKEVCFKNDSISIWIPVFDSEIRAIVSGDSLIGKWFNNAKGDYSMPFIAEHGVTQRFKNEIIDPTASVEGRWYVEFSPETVDSYPAIGEFTQENNLITGTFLTETGDYRYLEGLITGNQFMVSCFDGSHAFLFTANIADDMLLDGTFYSGKHWTEPWEAKKSDSLNIRDPYQLTFLKDGYDTFEFAFPDLNGDTVSIYDGHFKNKLIIVQIMGSWCPNCIDETFLLADIYDKYHEKGLEIVPIAFETADDMEKVRRNLNRLKEYTGAKYDFLYGGKADKAITSTKLPMLNKIISYPTTIFIDRKGKLRRVHTGFSGPGTGKHYTKYVDELHSFLKTLLNE
ncbi:MAG: TlpA family protein disulfide reductase [Bacteroidetes bacterium]|jgi:thiol-disulfide isomerase/thioredoxin|nr:TlpA family protein disulfide reductase [Bacteroidota bacterium]